MNTNVNQDDKKPHGEGQPQVVDVQAEVVPPQEKDQSGQGKAGRTRQILQRLQKVGSRLKDLLTADQFMIVTAGLVAGIGIFTILYIAFGNSESRVDRKIAIAKFAALDKGQLDYIAAAVAKDVGAGVNARLEALTKQVEELKNRKVETVNLDPVLVEVRKINEKVSEKLGENVKVDFGPILAQIQKLQEKPTADPVTPTSTSSTTSSSLSAPTDSINDVKVILKELQEIKARLGGNQTFDFMFALSALEAKVNSLPKEIFDQSFVGSNMDSPSKGKVSVFNALDEDGSVHLYWEKVEKK